MTDIQRAEDNPELEPIAGHNRRDWEVVPPEESAVAASRLGAMIFVRLDPEVACLVRQAAAAERISQSEFGRRAAEEQAIRLVK